MAAESTSTLGHQKRLRGVGRRYQWRYWPSALCVALAGTWSAAVGKPLADHFQELHEHSRGVVLAPSDQEIETRGGRVQRYEQYTRWLKPSRECRNKGNTTSAADHREEHVQMICLVRRVWNE